MPSRAALQVVCGAGQLDDEKLGAFDLGQVPVMLDGNFILFYEELVDFRELRSYVYRVLKTSK